MTILVTGATGTVGRSVVEQLVKRGADVRALIELVRREKSATPLPLVRINLVGPDTLTGVKAAAIWSEMVGRTIAIPATTPPASRRSSGNSCRVGWLSTCG